MKKALAVVVTWIFCLAVVFPISYSTVHWYFSAFTGLVITAIFIGKLIQTRAICPARSNSIIIGLFTAFALWILTYIDTVAQLHRDIIFCGSFAFTFIVLALYMLEIEPTPFKKIFSISISVLSIAGFVLLLTLAKASRGEVWLSILLGGFLGIPFGSLITALYRSLAFITSRIYTHLTEYIAVFIQPATAFFSGYLVIALIYSGIYNLLFICNKSSFIVPEKQIGLVDFILYAVDTMTTGGDSPISAHTMLAQFVNTLNVFTSIVWMTVVLASTIGYATEKFDEIKKKHKSRGKARV